MGFLGPRGSDASVPKILCCGTSLGTEVSGPPLFNDFVEHVRISELNSVDSLVWTELRVILKSSQEDLSDL